MTVQSTSERQPLSHYPIALVPGQFQEFYRNFSAAELLYVYLLTRMHQFSLLTRMFVFVYFVGAIR